MSFGVPIQNTFPVTCEGVLKTAAHAKWLTRRRAREAAFLKSGRHTSSSTSAQSSLDFPGIELPTAEDILLGRGKMNQDHVGNVWMRSVIQDYLPLYRATPKREKGKVPFQVVQHIQGQGGRFLKRDDAHGGWWVPVTDEVAREKISMAFRTSNSSSNNPTRHSESGPRAVPVRGTTVSSTSTSEVGPGSKRFRRDGGESPNSGSVGSVLPVVASFSTHNHFTFPPQPQQPPLLAPIQQHPQQQGQTQGEQSPFLGFFQRM